MILLTGKGDFDASIRFEGLCLLLRFRSSDDPFDYLIFKRKNHTKGPYLLLNCLFYSTTKSRRRRKVPYEGASERSVATHCVACESVKSRVLRRVSPQSLKIIIIL